MNPEAFLGDLERKPEAMRRLAGSLTLAREHGGPWPHVTARRIVMIGMGSSRYAAGVAATSMRMAGLEAVAEHASLVAGTPPSGDVLAVGISASGETAKVSTRLANRDFIALAPVGISMPSPFMKIPNAHHFVCGRCAFATPEESGQHPN